MTSHSRERHRDVTHEPRTRRPSTAPYMGQWVIWFAVLPAVGTLIWWIGQDITWCVAYTSDHLCKPHAAIPLAPGRQDARALAIGYLFLVAAVLSLIGLGVGLKVTKRQPFVVAHVAATPWLAAVCVWLTGSLGWSWPWAVGHAALSCIGAFGWNLYRLDALRSERGEKDKAADDTFGAVIGLPRAKVGKPSIDEHHIRATIDPGVGKTMGDVAGRLEAIEDQVKPALPGRSRLERDPITKRISMIFMHNDPLEPWPLWSGPSNPGGSFVDGGVAGQYADAQPERIRFAACDDDNGLPLPAQHFCSVGMARSGKTGHASVLWTDLVFTRRNALMVYADGAKPGQSLAGQLQDDIALFAGSVAHAVPLFELLLDLTKWRAERMGAAGFRDWSPEVHRRLGFAAVFVAVDEGDLMCGKVAFRNLVTKCLSAGIFVHAILPRLDGDSMDTTARTAIGQTATFGTGDDYSHTFTMSKRTVLAGGGKVCDWKASKPGYHIVDAAPGVDESRYPMDIRSLRADFDQLIPHIVDGRRYRATWSPDECTYLSKHKHWAVLQPKRTPAATWSPVPTAVQSARPAPTIPAAPSGQTKERIEMHPDPNANPYDDAPPDAIPDVPAMDDPEPGDRERYANADPAESIAATIAEGSADDYEWAPNDSRPEAPNPQAARDAVDLVVRQFVDEGKDMFTLAEFHQAYPFRRSVSWSSRRMAELAAGDRVVPPGATIERIGNVGEGAYAIIRDPTVIPGALIAGHTA